MRYIILTAAVCMQMCLGATYSWSVYVQPIKEMTGLLQGPVQIPFTVFYFIFPLSMLIAGNLLEKIGTRRSAMIGGLFFGGGWMLAGLGSHSFIFTITGIGVLAGIGAGMAYIVPIAVCIRWFPEKKGLVTGTAVAGFGGGAALVSKLGGWFMTSLHFTPFDTFFAFGLVFLITVFLAGTTMRLPEPQRNSARNTGLNTLDIVKQPAFITLYIAMFCGLAAGFAINANLKEMYSGTVNIVQVGITGVAIFAIANGTGRIIWGLLFDQMRSASAISVNLVLQSVVLCMAPFMVKTAMGFWVLALLSGFNYGGVLVIYVSSASRLWGADRVGQVYGYLFSSNIPASVSPIIAGMVFDAFQSFQSVYYVLASVLICCAFFVVSRGRELFCQVSGSAV